MKLLLGRGRLWYDRSQILAEVFFLERSDRAKNVKEIGLSANCSERKQAPRFDASRWNYGVVIESMEGRPLLGVQEVKITSVASLAFICVRQRRKVLPSRASICLPVRQNILASP